VRQALGSPVPPERKAPAREAPVREAVAGWIDAMLAEDLDAPRKQWHTARRIFERLRDEHDAGLSYSYVAKYGADAGPRSRRRRGQTSARRSASAASPAPPPSTAPSSTGTVTCLSRSTHPRPRPRPAPQYNVIGAPAAPNPYTGSIGVTG